MHVYGVNAEDCQSLLMAVVSKCSHVHLPPFRKGCRVGRFSLPDFLNMAITQLEVATARGNAAYLEIPFRACFQFKPATRDSLDTANRKNLISHTPKYFIRFEVQIPMSCLWGMQGLGWMTSWWSLSTMLQTKTSCDLRRFIEYKCHISVNCDYWIYSKF